MIARSSHLPGRSAAVLACLVVWHGAAGEPGSLVSLVGPAPAALPPPPERSVWEVRDLDLVLRERRRLATSEAATAGERVGPLTGLAADPDGLIEFSTAMDRRSLTRNPWIPPWEGFPASLARALQCSGVSIGSAAVAFVNGATCRVGDTVEGWRVEGISGAAVALSFRGVTVLCPVGRHIRIR